MAFKMKKKGFPMKGESPNKIRDYSSAMDMKKEESPNKALDIDVTKDGEEIMYDFDRGETGQTRNKRVQDALKYEKANRRMRDRNVEKAEDEYSGLQKQLEDAQLKYEDEGYSGEFPLSTEEQNRIMDRMKEIEQGKNVEGGESLYDIKYSGEDARQRKLLDKDRYSYERGKGSDTYPVGTEGITDDAGIGIDTTYTDTELRDERKKRREAADSPASMKSGFKMKSPFKAPNVNVYRDGQEYLYGDADDPNSVIDETKKAMEFEEKNKKIIDRNYDENREKITDLEYKIQDAEDSGNTKLAEQLQKQIDDITNEGIFTVDYSGKHAIQRDMAGDIGMMEGREGSQYVEGGDLVTGASYVGEEPDSLRIGATMGEDAYGNPMMVGGKRVKYYGDPMDPKKQGTQEFIDAREESDDLLDEQRRKRKEAADSPAEMKKQKSPIEMKKGFKMKGNPYKMGKMQTASAVKMAKEAMAKMKKENSAMDMKSPAKQDSSGKKVAQAGKDKVKDLKTGKTKFYREYLDTPGDEYEKKYTPEEIKKHVADQQKLEKNIKSREAGKAFSPKMKKAAPTKAKSDIVKGGTKETVEVKGKKAKHKDITSQGGFNEKISKGVKAGNTKVYQRADGSKYTVKTKAADSPAKAAKPDYPDIDGDGNTTESMKQAAADKKAGPNKLKRATKEERTRMAKGDKKMTPEMMEAIKKRGKAVAKMKKEDSPNKKYKSAAQRKAVHASKADGGKGNPNKMKKKNG